MKKWCALSTMILLAGAANLHAGQNPLVITSSNAAQGNQLLAYDTTGTLVQTLPTGGLGGVSGNAGGISAAGRMVAVVNFGSQSVSLFLLTEHGLTLSQIIGTVSPPVSVAFGHNHLYVLGTTHAESHRIRADEVDTIADGMVPLVRADGSAAQVGVVRNQLLITEKSNTVEMIDLRGGAVSGPAVEVPIPAGSDTPFGLTTRGRDGYVTIAHSDQVGLFKQGTVVALTGSGTEHSPCWLTLVGQYLYATNSPSHSISRYLVSGKQVVLEEPIVATTAGAPTDIGSAGNLVAVLDGGAQTHLTQFRTDEDGQFISTISSVVIKGANGVAVIER